MAGEGVGRERGRSDAWLVSVRGWSNGHTERAVVSGPTTYLLTYLPTYQPTNLPTYQPTYLPTYLLTSLPPYLLAYLSTSLTTYLLTLSEPL